MTWQDDLPAELTVQADGKDIPLKEAPLIKETPDVSTLAKRFYDTHQAFHSRVAVPGKAATPEEVAAFKKRVFESGHFAAPPESADKYDIARPDGIPEQAWSEDLVKELRTVAHKHGMSQAAVADLVALDARRFNGLEALLQADYDASKSEIEAKAKELGKSYKEIVEAGGRWMEKNMDAKDVQILAKAGLDNNPRLMWLIAKAGLESGEDISTGGEEGGDSADLEEAARIQGDKSHPLHQRWLDGDPEVQAKIEAAYKKKYGTKEV